MDNVQAVIPDGQVPMYFLSEVEHKLLIHKLLSTAREVQVSPQLRGWNWYQPPLKPYHDTRLPMYSVVSKFCPTDRDIYLSHVERSKAPVNFRMVLGKIVHGVVSDCLLDYLRQRDVRFDEWWNNVRWDEIPYDPGTLRKPAEASWNYMERCLKARYSEFSAAQPYASEQDRLASTAPFLVEHKISGELLGLSGLLSLDCYDYLRGIMFDLTVDSRPKEWHRLAPVGYALVFESVHEVPIDVCGVVYVSFLEEKLSVRKDLFFANDELRSWWIQERDRKLEIVAEGRDPGKPSRSECEASCIQCSTCWGESPSRDVYL